MKKIISIIIVLLALISLTHCKLAEVETIEEIPCPEIGIDSIIIPPWDMKTEQEIYPFIENQ